MNRGGGRFLQVFVIVVVLSAGILSVAQPGRAAPSPDSPASGPGPAPSAFVPFSPNLRVNSVNLGFNYQVEPTLAINSQGRIFVGWKEAFTHNGGGQRVGFAYSTDGGNTFSPNILMPLARLPRQSDPWLTVTRDDRVYFTRIEYDTTAVPGGISVTNTTDGVTWGTTYFLDDRPNFADKESAAHDVAGNVYLVWNSDSANAELVSSRSNDGGATWTPKVRVADSATGSLGGIIAVHTDGTLLATWWSWLTDDILFDRSFDGGATWGTDIRVNSVPGSARGAGAWQIPIPAMNVDPASGTVYVAWPDSRSGNQDIYVAASTDRGLTWGANRRIDDDPGAATQYMVDLAVDPAGAVHAAWEDRRSGNWNIYYANSTDGGQTWSANTRVSTADTPAAYTRPGDYFAIESDRNGTVYVVWTDGRGADLDIYFAKLERTVQYTIDTVPAGLTVTVDGTDVPAPASVSWRPGTTHTLFTPSPQAVGPQTRRAFASWSDGGGQTHTITTGEANATITAAFRTEHEVAVRTSPAPLDVLVDGIRFVGSTSLWWVEGSPHNLAAPSPQPLSPGARYVFASWSDGGGSDHAVSPSAPALFEVTYRLQHLLTVGSVRGTPTGGGWYNATALASFGIEGTVAGPPGTRYVFSGWSGDSTAISPSASVVMDGPKNVTARWRTEHLLTIVSPYGTPQSAGWHTEGRVVQVSIEDTVTANGTTYRFAGWTGGATETSSVVFVTMDAPKTLTATWEVVPPPGSPGTSALDLLPWAIVIVVIAVVVIALLIWRRRRKKEGEARPPPSSS